jgi:hypothetical protein
MRHFSQQSANNLCGSPEAQACEFHTLIGAYTLERGKRVSALFLCGIIWLALLLSACAKPAPEQALRDTLAKLESAATAKDSAAFFTHFAEDFAGSEGMDRDNFRRYVQIIWLRHKDIGVQMGPLDVKIMEERATVNFSVALSGGQGLIPDQGQIYQVQTGWRLDGDDWKLISATWKPTL